MADTSNRERGHANHKALKNYFDRVGATIPRKPDGSGDIAAIVRDVPLTSRQVIYQNKRNRELCDERFELHGIPPIATRGSDIDSSSKRSGEINDNEEKKQLRQRVSQLERELLIARGETMELRRDMLRYKAIDEHLAETGRLPR